jgi:hypothetical protein
MQGLSVPVVATALIASVSLPMVALNVTDMPGGSVPAAPTPAQEALILAEECRHYADQVGHYRRRLMGAYADPADRDRERQLLMYYERRLGRDCVERPPSG